ncbi:hypothetical protein MC885_002407, partial [Smutsia gigantea]
GMALPLMGRQVSSSGSFPSLPGTMNMDWMSALCPQLWDVPIHHLSIPGVLGGSHPALAEMIDLCPQTLNVTEQLDARVRYLDLCIAHMLEGSERNLHFGHFVYTTALVEEVPTLRQLWARGQQMLVSYEDEGTVSWHVGLIVAGINLTENLAYILLHPSESLKTMTLPSLPYLSRWVQEQCPGLGTQCTNIIEGNFIGMDAFTSDVIWLNEKMLPC